MANRRRGSGKGSPRGLLWYVAAALAVALLALPAGALAHGAERDGVALHVGDRFSSCYFDLHPELTKSEFRRFAAEGGQLSHFRSMAAADLLASSELELTLAMTHSIIDDAAGAWNDTMSHPAEDHYLGEAVSIPQLVFRMNLAKGWDVEAMGTLDPRANYGIVGAGAKVALLQQAAGAPVSLALRPTLSALIAPPETGLLSLGSELLVSRRLLGLAPFVGLGVRGTLAIDAAGDTDVGNQMAVRPAILTGLDYQWKALSLGAQVDYSSVLSFGARLGVRL